MRKTVKGKRLQDLACYLWQQVILPNLIWTAFIGVPSAGVSAYSIYKMVSEFIRVGTIPTPYLVLTIVTLVIDLIILIIGILYLISHFLNKRNVPAFPKLTFDYKVISSEYELFFTDREHITQTQDVCLEVLCESIEEITHNMTWTGQKYCKSDLSSECKDVELVDTDRTTPPYSVKIRFKHPLRSGDSASYKFQTRVEDQSRIMMPRLSKIIKCQTDKLMIRVTAPKGMLKNVVSVVATDYTLDIPLGNPKPIPAKSVGLYDSFEWSIEELELLRCYSICWDFS